MILWQIALRNLWLQKFKSMVVGGILLLGTALVVIGNAVLDRLDETTAIAIINSVSGHAQVYAASSKDEFEIFRGFDSSTREIDPIPDFQKVKSTLEEVPGVKTVVPMGMDYAVVFSGNILDRKLNALRTALDEKNTDESAILLAHIKRIVRVLREQMANLEDVANMELVNEQSKSEFSALESTAAETFWSRWKTEPYEVLEFLENKVAKLALGEDLVWMRYIGTDTAAFAKTFDRFTLEDGEMMPEGRRGFMFNKLTYERHFKNKTAWRLDMIQERLDNGETFGECEDCQTWTSQNKRQAASVAYQMDDRAAAETVTKLQAFLDSGETELIKLLEGLLDMNGGNFVERYAVFYDVVAPRIILYTVNIGDTLVLTSYNGGYVRKVPVKVYGTFKFESLDRSPIAGGFSLMDLVTFRELYGYMTDEKRAELKAMQEEAGLKDVSDDEEALFGGDDDLVDDAEASDFDPMAGLDMSAGGERYTEELFDEVYDQKQIDEGIVLHAAVMFEQGADFEDTMAALEAANQKHALGLNVITWRKAAGMVGKFIDVIRAVLYGAVFIIFIVALVIINNSMMMSTMERTVEIGTMRAIGAQRTFVRRMILLETGVMALLFGGGGALLGSGIVLAMGHYGIPAWNDITFFIFAGPRFQPDLLPIHLIAAMFTIALVALGSAFYPSLIATRVTPREAMSAAED